MPSLYKKLTAVRSAVSVPKGQRNTFAGYDYRSLEDITKAVNPVCQANGCGYFLSDNPEEIAGRVYIKATATFYADDSEATLAVTAYARECEHKKGMDDAQLTGASSSYARKYALCGLFAIDGGDDPDKMDNRPRKQQPKQQADHVDAAKHRLWGAVKAYAQASGLDAKAMYTDAMGECPKQGAAEWLEAKADEFAQAAS